VTSAEQPEPGPGRPVVAKRPGWRYRHGDGLEFDRVAFFSDALYAIAMTLLIVVIEVPELPEDVESAPAALWAAIREQLPGLFAFFLAFYLLSRFWVAHHSFVSSLAAYNRALISMNMVYLAFVASLPFTSGLVGRYFSNPVSVALFATALLVISAMETVMFWYAHRAGLLRIPLTPAVFRAALANSTLPSVLFLISIPVAFVSSLLAVLLWLLAIPIGLVIDRLTGVRSKALRDKLEG
jgi:uncharacterized membrane protein